MSSCLSLEPCSGSRKRDACRDAFKDSARVYLQHPKHGYYKISKEKKAKGGAMQELQRTTRESNHATERSAILAAVVPEKAHPFVLEELDLDEPREDGGLGRVAAMGICKTDLFIRDKYYQLQLPV